MTKDNTLIVRMTTTTGFKSSGTHTISLAQWREICSVLDDAPLVSRLLEANRIIAAIVRQINAGGDDGKVFARDSCVQDAVAFMNGRGLPMPNMFWDEDGEEAFNNATEAFDNVAEDFRDVVEVHSAVDTGKRWLAIECVSIDEGGEPDDTVVRVCDERIVATNMFQRSFEALVHTASVTASVAASASEG